jgi:phosphate/sulfate permease
MEIPWIVILIILVALFFDFLNGMNDAANSIATVVGTRVLSPRLAVAWAAFFNFAAAFVLARPSPRSSGGVLWHRKW